MKRISLELTNEVLARHGLSLGSWRQVIAPSRLSISAVPAPNFRATVSAASKVLEWLCAQDWLMCCFDYSNSPLPEERDFVGSILGVGAQWGDETVLFEKADLSNICMIKCFASAALGFEWHCYLVAGNGEKVSCVAFLDGVVEFICGDGTSASALSAEIGQHS